MSIFPLKAMKHPRARIALLIVAVAFVGFGLFAVQRCPTSLLRCARALYVREVAEDDYEPADIWTGVDEVELYGVQYPPEEEYDRLRRMGIDTILIDFSIGADPARWVEQLDLAGDADLSVVAWLWKPGWSLDEGTGTWKMDPRAATFLETVEGHPALFAVYGTHEAYWNGCFDCGYTTEQLQDLYSQIKEIADVPVYSSFGEFHYWANMGPETTFADGICDYCDSWYYPVREGGEYDIEKYRRTLELELSRVRELAPESQFIWVLQGFGSEQWGKELPSRDQLREMVAIAAEADVDGVWFYPWKFDSSEYESVLGDAPELQEVIAESAPLFGRRGAE